MSEQHFTGSQLTAANGQPKLRPSEVLYRFFTLASVASLVFSLWAAPYFKTTQPPGLLMSLALYNAICVCPGLIFLQFVNGFYLAVRKFDYPVDWRRLVFCTLISVVVFWANLRFGVARPFFDSWD